MFFHCQPYIHIRNAYCTPWYSFKIMWGTANTRNKEIGNGKRGRAHQGKASLFPTLRSIPRSLGQLERNRKGWFRFVIVLPTQIFPVSHFPFPHSWFYQHPWGDGSKFQGTLLASDGKPLLGTWRQTSRLPFSDSDSHNTIVLSAVICTWMKVVCANQTVPQITKTVGGLGHKRN